MLAQLRFNEGVRGLVREYICPEKDFWGREIPRSFHSLWGMGILHSTISREIEKTVRGLIIGYLSTPVVVAADETINRIADVFISKLGDNIEMYNEMENRVGLGTDRRGDPGWVEIGSVGNTNGYRRYFLLRGLLSTEMESLWAEAAKGGVNRRLPRTTLKWAWAMEVEAKKPE